MKFLLFFLLFSTLAIAETPTPDEKKETVETTGAIVIQPPFLLEEDPTLLTSTIQIVLRGGSEDDPPGKFGLSNLMAELMLRGTKTRSRTAFQSELERLGAAFAARVAHDRIVFVGRVIKENTGAFLKLVQECLLNPAFSPQELAALKTETLNDLSHIKNSNNRLSGLAVRRHLYGGTPLERPTEGSQSSVKALRREDILREYNLRFHRGNFVFAVASPFKEAELKKAMTEMWRKFPDGPRHERHAVEVKQPEKPTLVVVHKPKTSTGAMMMGQKGITADDPQRYALGMGNFSFGGEPLVSRLFKVIRGELGWTYAIGSTYHATGSLSHQPGFFVISSTPAVEFTAKTILKALAMWKDYLENGLKSDELSLAQDSLVNSYPFEFDSAEKRLSQKLHSFLYGVPILSPEEYAKTIRSIDNGKLRRSLNERQKPNGWLIAVVADSKEIERQLAEEQKDVAPEERLTISKTITPDFLIK